MMVQVQGYNLHLPAPTINPPITLITGTKAMRVTSPFSPNLVELFRSLKGKWDPSRKTWIVPNVGEEKVLEALEREFGWSPDNPNPPLIPIEITLLNDISAKRRPVVVAGIILASALERDGGARPGPGVSLLEGEILSGGSTNYWTSKAKEGTVWRCHATQGQIAILQQHEAFQVTPYPPEEDLQL